MKTIVLFLCCILSQAFAQNRSSSLPYLSGDTFRAYADFVIDETNLGSPFSAKKVKPGNTIFLKVDYLEHFFRKIHPKIRSRYILITHNGDGSHVERLPGAVAI